MTRTATIGLDRRIDIEWLDAAAAQAAAGRTPEEIRAYLKVLLDGVVRGEGHSSARGKTITVLSHIWGDVPPRATGLRGRALELLPEVSADERAALHWAMLVGTYPIFVDVAAAAGRLIKLQGRFTLALLTRRLITTWGDRSTIRRAAQRIVRSMVQWEVLRDTETRGEYEAATRPRRVGPTAGALLIEALLVDARDAAIPLDQLISHPAIFPFDLDVNASHVRGASQFRVHRQGLDSDFVELQGGRA